MRKATSPHVEFFYQFVTPWNVHLRRKIWGSSWAEDHRAGHYIGQGNPGTSRQYTSRDQKSESIGMGSSETTTSMYLVLLSIIKYASVLLFSAQNCSKCILACKWVFTAEALMLSPRPGMCPISSSTEWGVNELYWVVIIWLLHTSSWNSLLLASHDALPMPVEIENKHWVRAMVPYKQE